MEQFINFFINSAYADSTAASPQSGGGLSMMLMFGVFIFFLYFAIWRPQAKRAKEQQNLLNSLAKGDEVVTAGGIVGKITKIADSYLALTVDENVELVMQKSAVISVLPKGTLKSIE